MTDFGGKLRQARERRGVSLRQIAASTKISMGALEALERNDVSKLPGGIFSRAFVRSYAIEVGLDPDETVREFLERFHEEPVPAAAATPRVTTDESGFESQQRMASVLLKLVLISAVIIGVILYLTLRDRGGKSSGAAGPTTATPQAAALSPAVDNTPPPTPAPPVRADAPSIEPPPAAGGPMRLELHPTGVCWIVLTIDGRHVMSKLMEAGQREAFAVRDAAVIDVGDAGTFAFSVNGRPGRPLGDAGQRRTARITRETLATWVQ